MVCERYNVVVIDIVKLRRKFRGSPYAKALNEVLEAFMTQRLSSLDIKPLKGYTGCYRVRKDRLRVFISICEKTCCIVVWDAELRDEDTYSRAYLEGIFGSKRDREKIIQILCRQS